LLRRHICQCPHDDIRAGIVAFGLIQNLGNAEIGDEGVPLLVDENIGRLDIAVNDAVFMGVIPDLLILK